jgi:hypothetical protein
MLKSSLVVLTAVEVKYTIFCNVASYSLESKIEIFEGTAASSDRTASRPGIILLSWKKRLK